MQKKIALWIGVVLSLAFGLACNLSPTPTPIPTATPSPTLAATPTATPIPTAAPTATPQPQDTGWGQVIPGLERRTQRVANPAGQVVETVTLLRLEPDRFDFQVAYTPDNPRTVQQWAADTQAAITLNAGYFGPENMVIGVHVVDGATYGVSYGDFAGMFAVRPESVEIRWLRQRPYDPNEPLLAAVQSFPLLVKPGGVHGFPEEDGMNARRTVIAQDRAGRILIILCPAGAFTLHRLATYLVESDLDLDTALNLDGGPSSGLALALGPEPIQIPSYVPAPAVILITPK